MSWEGQKKDIKIFYFILFFLFETINILLLPVYELFIFFLSFLIISHWHAKNVNGTNGEWNANNSIKKRASFPRF